MRTYRPHVEPHGRGLFLVQSESRPDETHAVDIEEGTCSCEDVHFRKRECKHTRFIRELMDRAKIMLTEKGKS
jgi:hypothetical protein